MLTYILFMKNRKLYDELIVNLTDFMCIVSEEDNKKVQELLLLVTEYKIKEGNE